MFKDFKLAMQKHFNDLLEGQQTIFLASADKDKLWDTYLATFPEAERQEHNCNCCKQFIRHYGNMVVIKDNKMISIWDFVCGDATFDEVGKALSKEIHKTIIKEVFITKIVKLGTDSNKELLEDKSVRTWEHMFIHLPKEFATNKSKSEEALMGEIRDIRNVFKRSLDEITDDSVETVLDLIGQNSLYRGEESKGVLQEFLNIKKKYNALPEDQRENYCWVNAPRYSASVAKIRNTAIGTLLVDISKGEELDKAVKSFDRIMAPTNYKRPNAIISKKQIEQAEETIKELGYELSLGRRFAHVDDITTNNLLFRDRDTKKDESVFGALKDSVAVNPKQFSKMEEISVDKFINEILPKINSLEVMFENRHMNNLVSLIAPNTPGSPSMFKWDNGFSWSYRNALTDSMKQRVKDAGGNVEGVLRFSIQWNEDGKSICDFDAHATEPNGTHISYSSEYRKDRHGPKTSMSGILDVDMICPRTTGVENIVWDNKSKMKPGKYKFSIVNYDGGSNSGFDAQVEFDGQIHNFHHAGSVRGRGVSVHIATITLDKDGTFSIENHLPSTNAVGSNDVWGIGTNKFHKVSMVMRSPNCWNGKTIGNSHLFFIMEGAHNDETVRGFFNEFLKPELETHRRVFEALGGKMKVEPSDKQVSGLGFSSTQPTELICKVGGTFDRVIKVKF